MKVTRLQSSNIMRLIAVDITPEGNLITIGGKNGAGKSAVLNSVAMALGGMSLVPQEPIRTGESEATVTLNMDDGIVVVRKFFRDKIHQNGCDSLSPPAPQTEPFKCNCKPTWSPTRSTLIVKNKEGFVAPTPQALLDKLLMKLTFDPLAFKDDPKKDVTLRKLVNLDVSDLDQIRTLAFAQRAVQKKTLEVREAQLIALPKHEGVPSDEISIEEITQEMQRAEEQIKIAQSAERALELAGGELVRAESELVRHENAIAELERRIETERELLSKQEKKVAKEKSNVVGLRTTAEEQRKAVPDMAAIRQQLTDTTTTNEKIRANQKYQSAFEEVVDLQDSVRIYQETIEKSDAEKKARLNAVQFPVPGLGLSDEYGVTFNDLPFEQASTADQLRVSVAIGLALNPKLKVLLIRSGNLLDEDSLKLVALQAEAAEAQIWMEYVTSDAKDVQVMIVDGKVAEES